ncbi:TIGR04222 domain-containing membrane protein [Prauserella flavalba]|uniref:TIGR04222 domain-containing membrane protein n=1 Tax=Prauserella flavalba TaxID=1477506 RepID=UPI0036EE803D
MDGGVLACACAGGLSAAALLLRGVPFRARHPVTLSPAEAGFLRGGPRSAAGAALGSLADAGRVEPHPAGGARRTYGTQGQLPDPLERAVYSALHDRLGPRALRHRPEVRRALPALVRRLAVAGLVPGRVRWVAVRLALAGVGMLAVARWAHGETRPWVLAVLGAAVALAAVVWMRPRRTVTGSRALRGHTRAASGFREAAPDSAGSGGAAYLAWYSDHDRPGYGAGFGEAGSGAMDSSGSWSGSD